MRFTTDNSYALILFACVKESPVHNGLILTLVSDHNFIFTYIHIFVTAKNSSHRNDKNV